jgi:hypothetical protein
MEEWRMCNDGLKVSAAYIDWAHGPGAEDGQPLAMELCALPVKNKQVCIPLTRQDLIAEIASVAELYVGGRPGDNYPRAGRVLARARAALSNARTK